MDSYHTDQTGVLHLKDTIVINEELRKPDRSLFLKECES